MKAKMWKWVGLILSWFDDYQIQQPMPLDGKDRT